MINEIIGAIKKAECESENIEESALKKEKQMAKDAYKQAEKVISDATSNAEIISRDIIKNKESEAKIKAEQILSKGKAAAAAVKSTEEGKISLAVKLIIGRIVDVDGNS
ncbi:MAG: hypothetical protein QME45_03420 [Clostridiales bacterium]|nr:hypothetical protein [Clostridiales bacterium]